MVLGGFGEGFGRILERFWKGLEGKTYIRATKGNSMDGWRRPNHMRSQIGSPKAMRPVNFRRGVREFHSVAKQASFYVALGTDFRGFRRPNWTPKVDFRAFFFDVISECVFVSNFNRFWEAPNSKNSNFA